jgi:hypothetical protein
MDATRWAMAQQMFIDMGELKAPTDLAALVDLRFNP